LSRVMWVDKYFVTHCNGFDLGSRVVDCDVFLNPCGAEGLAFWVENCDFDSKSRLGFEKCQVSIEYLDQV